MSLTIKNDMKLNALGEIINGTGRSKERTPPLRLQFRINQSK